MIAVVLPCFSAAQEMTLEKVSGDRVFVLATCDYLHAITGVDACTTFHFTKKKVAAEPGQTVFLNDKPYVIEWMGAGYYTASGRLVQTNGKAAHGVLNLLQLRPDGGNLQAAWQDLDHDGALSVGDTIEVDGRDETIVDKRLNVRVKPAN